MFAPEPRSDCCQSSGNWVQYCVFSDTNHRPAIDLGAFLPKRPRCGTACKSLILFTEKWTDQLPRTSCFWATVEADQPTTAIWNDCFSWQFGTSRKSGRNERWHPHLNQKLCEW